MTTIKIPLTIDIVAEQLKQIQQIEGVTEVRVTDDNQLIVVAENDESDVISQVLDKINDFDAGLSVTASDFPVEKLTCGGCAASAERLLNNQPGVVTASVKFPTKSAKIYYLQNKTTPLKLKVALEQLGYDLKI